MPRRNRSIAARCDLGVTGKQVRRALPLIPPSPSFRDALRRELWRRTQGPDMEPRVAAPSDIPARPL